MRLISIPAGLLVIMSLVLVLTENLREGGVFFEEGARWLAAEELARYGLEQVLKDFPRLAD